MTSKFYKVPFWVAIITNGNYYKAYIHIIFQFILQRILSVCVCAINFVNTIIIHDCYRIASLLKEQSWADSCKHMNLSLIHI